MKSEGKELCPQISGQVFGTDSSDNISTQAVAITGTTPKPRVKITAVTPVCDMVGPVEEVAAECGKPSKCGPYTLNDYRSGDRDPIHKKKIGLSYGLKKHFVFGFRFPTLRSRAKN